MQGVQQLFHQQERFFKALSPQQQEHQHSFFKIGTEQQEVEIKTLSPMRLGQQMHSGERLTSLHSRLQKEAEKINKWKHQTEMQIQQRERKIQDTQQTIDSQRKSILELQLQNENLSSKLQEEIDGRVEIMKKITATRDMCYLLKDHAANVEERMGKCEANRDELQCLQQDTVFQLQELTSKFNNLRINHTEAEKVLGNKLKESVSELNQVKCDYQNEKVNVEKRLEGLMQQCSEKEMEISKLTGALTDKQAQLSDLEQQCSMLEEHVAKLEDEFKSLQDQLQEASDKIFSRDKEMEKISGELTNTEAQLQKVSDDCEQLESHIGLLKEQHSIEVTKINHQLDTVEEKLNVEKTKTKDISSKHLSAEQRIGELQASINEQEKKYETLIEEKSKVEGEKAAVEAEGVLLKENIMALETEQKSMKDQVSQLRTTVAVLTDAKIHAEEQLSMLEKEKKVTGDEVKVLTNTSAARDKEIKKLQDDLKKAAERQKEAKKQEKELKQQLKTKDAEVDKTSAKLKKVQGDLEEIQTLMASLQRDHEELKDKLNAADLQRSTLQSSLDEVNQEKVSLNDTLKQLEESLKAQDKEAVGKIHQQQESTKALQTELDSNKKSMTKLENRVKSLEKQVAEKTNKIKDLQQDNKTVKKELGIHLKLSNGFEEKAKSLEEEIAQVKKTAEDTKIELSTAKDEVQRVTTDKKQVQAHCEQQIMEMTATLEKYKAENQKIVNQKDKEIEKMRKEHQTSKKQDVQVADLMSQLQSVQQQLEDVKKEKDEMPKTKEYQQQVDMLKKTIEDKEGQLKELRTDLEKAKADALSPTTPKTFSTPKNYSTPKTNAPPSASLHQRHAARRNISRKENMPKTDPMVPLAASTPIQNKTPLQRIIKRPESEPKKRRVAFDMTEKTVEISMDGGDSEANSSTSELMELDPEDLLSGKPRGDQQVPGQASLQVHKSPSHGILKSPAFVRKSPAARFGAQARASPATKTPTPRGSKSYKVHISDSWGKKNKNVKQGPNKTPKSKEQVKKRNKSSERGEELSWFESDTVFGFFE
uniref:Synaptonemal complex protein 1 isoform 2 n=1 Tax=Branchiostoma lanceolatum TaxID=7740 RepID=A0A2I6SI41_BRALA|nr:synaptonemal complex protein 1 isoform 2 [Branchiostoma lanceolatum]